MAKIDKIQVGTDSYDINLPTTATPSIASLNISGNLNVDGTSNLGNVNLNRQEVDFTYSDINAGNETSRI